jgi:hypothetical protein
MERVTERGASCLVFLTNYHSIDQTKKDETRQVRGRSEIHSQCWCLNLKERDHFKSQAEIRRQYKMNSKELHLMLWNELISLRTGKCGGESASINDQLGNY